ncbi:MAG: hypothetical protein AMJ56_09495 [Anaerolineae bacterium SG8_19]|nr:MAG: hypothetical protein AMJ56_09495 [Anaerolineae bacterium SG8_19]
MTVDAKQPARPDGVTAIAVYYFLVAISSLYFPLIGLSFGLLTTLVLAVMAIVAGWGLLRMASWARWLAFGLAIISLLFFPIGTIIGAIIIWYLLKEDVREAFEAASM